MGILSVSAALDLILGNLWRTAALALLVVVGLQWVERAGLSSRLAHVESALSLSVSTAELAGDMRAAAEDSANAWKSVADDLNDRLSTVIRAHSAQRERDAAAVSASRAAEREANAVLSAWMDRYAEATREPSCRALMETPLCVALD